jgi:Bacterial mobilisation protein (MobC)
MQDCLTAAICYNCRSHERWNTSHNLGDARDEGAFRGRCASPRVVRFSTPQALGRADASECRRRRTGDTRGRRPDLSGLTLDGANPSRRSVVTARTCGGAGMAAATYVSVLTRSHLRSFAPLPKAEWLTLQKIVTELSKLGRNINQIARAANRGEPGVSPRSPSLNPPCARAPNRHNNPLTPARGF